jgi:hypothetical protein
MNFRRILFLNYLFSPTRSLGITGKIPKNIWGRKLILNGPSDIGKTKFDGFGHITSVNFMEEDKISPIISEVIVPKETDINFPLGDFIDRDFFGGLSKYFQALKEPNIISTQYCNTAVRKYLGKYYAVEESCRPVNLEYDDAGNIECKGRSLDIPRMAAHLINAETRFSYTPFDLFPLKYNNTIIPWSSKNTPLFIHTGRVTPCGRYMIFPLLSTGFGNIIQWILHKKTFPLSDTSNKFRWLVYDTHAHSCKELVSNEFIDIFHISKIELINDKINIFTTHIYNFLNWMSDTGELSMSLHKHTINLKENIIEKIEDLDVDMDFIHTQGNEFIGSTCKTSPEVIIYNFVSKKMRRMFLPGGIVREIIPLGKLLVYFSHEIDKSYLYIVSKITGGVLTKIQVPDRQPGFHTTMTS